MKTGKMSTEFDEAHDLYTHSKEYEGRVVKQIKKEIDENLKLEP